jgi:tetratricopeptide (TPR) repeat protein/TolB-like protein
MTPERWKRLDELFEAALALEPASRSAFLAVQCPDDATLRFEVEALLRSHEAVGGLATAPVYQLPRDPGMLERGSRLGRYEIIGLLGAGGMGEVYRARDPQLGREVGIKILPGGSAITPEQLARFEREARAVGALNHPNILTVYDVGVDRDTPYVVSELLEGETLRSRLKAGPLRPEDAIAVAKQIVSGLAAAHDKGVVHRDIKPDNLFITRDGVVRILDFGLARQTAPAPAQPDDSAITAQGLVMGTAGYMSPEQVRGQPADARSDVFAFGAVFYEMLTGRRAFAGESTIETLNAILTAEPSAPAKPPVPASLWQIVQTCLEKSPDRRFSSMRTIGLELDNASGAGFARRRRRVRWGLVAAMSIVVTVSSVALWSVRSARTPSPGASGRPALAVMPLEDHSNDPDLAWLSAGIPRMLVTALAQTPGLDVIGSDRLQSSFTELGLDTSEAGVRVRVARHAGAGAVLAGSFFKVGPDTRIDIHVEDVDSGQILAAGTEQGPDVFALVDELSERIRTALDVTRLPTARPVKDVTTSSLIAYELYVKGLDAWHNRRWSDARTIFEEAVRVDPTFALVHAQLAILLERLGEAAVAATHRGQVMKHLDRLPERQRLLTEAKQASETNNEQAIALLERLLERYPDEEEAYDLMVHTYGASRDPAVSQRTLALMERWARAIPGPGSGHFHNHYGYTLIDHGLFTEAEREFRAYIRVSPDEANPYDSLAELFLMTGRPDQAIELYDRALRINPLFGPSYFGRAYAHAMRGRYDQAIATMSKLEEIAPRSGLPWPQILLTSALIRSRAGRYREADDYAARSLQYAGETRDAASEIDAYLVRAVLAFERGRYGQALDAVRKAEAAVQRLSQGAMRNRRLALAAFVAGIVKARTGGEAEPSAQPAADKLERAWQHALTGEFALASRDFAAADRAFRLAEHDVPPNFGTSLAFVALANNLPFRDGLARVVSAQGDHETAIARYRRLNQPDVTTKWTSIVEPRFVLAIARLADRAGDRETARAEYARFVEFWKGADPRLPEIAEARAYLR